MSRTCLISNKRSQSGNSVSHANNRHRKVWHVNLHKKRLFDSETGRWVRVRVSSRVLRTIDKKGLSTALREAGLTINDVT